MGVGGGGVAVGRGACVGGRALGATVTARVGTAVTICVPSHIRMPEGSIRQPRGCAWAGLPGTKSEPATNVIVKTRSTIVLHLDMHPLGSRLVRVRRLIGINVIDQAQACDLPPGNRRVVFERVRP